MSASPSRLLVPAATDAIVEGKARRDAVHRLMNPRKGSMVSVQEKVSGRTIQTTIERQNGECIVFAARTVWNLTVA